MTAPMTPAPEARAARAGASEGTVHRVVRIALAVGALAGGGALLAKDAQDGALTIPMALFAAALLFSGGYLLDNATAVRLIRAGGEAWRGVQGAPTGGPSDA